MAYMENAVKPPAPAAELLRAELDRLDPQQADYAPRAVNALLAAAGAAGATDVHLQPGGLGLELKFRIVGVLQPVATLSAQVAGNVVARLKVLAGLLTYHSDRPQEGRIRVPVGQASRLPSGHAEMRVCTYPTLHGERAMVRLFGGAGQYEHLDDLGLAC